AGGCREAVRLAAPVPPPAQHAVREDAEAADVKWRLDRLEVAVDLERPRLDRPVEAVPAHGNAVRRMLGRVLVAAQVEDARRHIHSQAILPAGRAGQAGMGRSHEMYPYPARSRRRGA